MNAWNEASQAYAVLPVGVFKTSNPNGTNTQWSRLGTGLPDVLISDLEVNPSLHGVYVSLFGRGVWSRTSLPASLAPSPVVRYAWGMDQLASGVRDVQRGFGVLRAHPSLWKWIIAPAVVTLLLIAALVIGVLHFSDQLVDWSVAHLPSWLAHVASPVVTTMIVIGLSTCVVLVFVPLAGMIAGPFNEMLSEHVEAKLTGLPMTPFALRELLHGVALSILHGLRRLLAMLVGLVVVFAVGFVPVIGTIAGVVIAGWLAATATAYDCYDAVLARRYLGYRAKLAYLARYRQRTFGLGAAVAVMLLIPGLNLVALGLGAAGATVAAHALERDAGRAHQRRG